MRVALGVSLTFIAAAQDLFLPPLRSGQPSVQKILFEDLTPTGIAKETSWMSLGKDDYGSMYIGFTSRHEDTQKEDYLLFRYGTATGERAYLGSFMNASRAAGTLWPDEEIPKGHTHIWHVDGKMYLASQGFHDFKHEVDPDVFNALHGAHIFSYDIAAQTLEDATRDEPGGVAIAREGIVCHTYSPWLGLLVGQTHPYANITLFDVRESKLRKVVKGIPWQLDNPMSREIVVTKTGVVYLYRGTEACEQRFEQHPIWRYDLTSDEDGAVPTAFNCTMGMWNGQARTADGDTIYVSTTAGELYKLDVNTDSWSHLGNLLPEAKCDYWSQDYLWALSLSSDEKYLYGILSGFPGMSSGDMYRFDIATGHVSLVLSLGEGLYTGSNTRIGNTLYFTGADIHSTIPYLLSITL